MDKSTLGDVGGTTPSLEAHLDGPRTIRPCLRDGLVAVAGRVLVDHGCARAGVAEPDHQFLKGHAGSSGESAAGVSQVLEVNAGGWLAGHIRLPLA